MRRRPPRATQSRSSAASDVYKRQDHLTAEDQRSMLPNAMLSSMKSIVAESDNRICRLLFKMAVQLAVTMNVVAANSEIDDVSLERLKGECVKEVKRLNGNFTFKDANDWQKG